MNKSARRQRDEADVVVLELIRLVTSAQWDVGVAAGRLLAKRHSPGALWQARSRVLHAQMTTPSTVATRAEDVLKVALVRIGREREATALMAGALERF